MKFSLSFSVQEDKKGLIYQDISKFNEKTLCNFFVFLNHGEITRGVEGKDGGSFLEKEICTPPPPPGKF